MDEQKKHNLTAKIADVEPFKLQITLNEESFYRHIIEQLNKIWGKIHYGPNGVPSQVALAKVALYFAEMYYRKSALAADQSRTLADFEAGLDKALESMD